MNLFEIVNLNDSELDIKLKENKIGLSIFEARKICTILGRNPTLTELIIWSNQGSEHASYKSTKKFLKTLPTNGPNVILGPVEDSGVVKLCDLSNGDSYGIVVSHESHNSPSQIVPYEGAATGVGGIIRDIICMGSKAIGVLDSLRFGDLNNEKSRLIAKGCVNGIAGYANPIGVPNLGGNAYFDENFKNMCLVNVFALGLIKKSQLIHSFVPDSAENEKYEYILIGKATDNSGFGGAAFSSKIIDETKTEENKGVVQEPNPFLERHIMASTYDLFKILEEEGHLDKVGFKDLGAGGIVCASIELVDKKGLGAEIDLNKVHVGIDNLEPQVIACSETQERFMWVVHHSLTQKILDHYNIKWDLGGVSKGAKASCIGEVIKGGIYKIKYNSEYVCEARAKDITEGIMYDRQYKNPGISYKEPSVGELHDILSPSLQKIFLRLLSSPNMASQECIYEKYDKNVQGNTVIERSEAEACVIRPLYGEIFKDENLKNIGISACQIGSGRYGLISPFDQGANAISRACLVIACTGAVPQCITDCMNYGNPEKEDQMWAFVEGLNGIKDACINIGLKGTDNPLPIISGNVSLYKEVPPSAIIGCVGIIDNYKYAINSKIKRSDSTLILIGKRKNELGGSELYRLHGILGANVAKSNFNEIQKITYLLPELIKEGKILSAISILEGGMIGAITKMIMPNQKNNKFEIGVELDISYSNLETYQELFSESLGVIIEVGNEYIHDIADMFGDSSMSIGKTINTAKLIIKRNGEESINIDNKDIYDLWRMSLRNYWI